MLGYTFKITIILSTKSLQSHLYMEKEIFTYFAMKIRGSIWTNTNVDAEIVRAANSTHRSIKFTSLKEGCVQVEHRQR